MKILVTFVKTRSRMLSIMSYHVIIFIIVIFPYQFPGLVGEMVNFYIYSMDWPVKMLITFVETMLHMWKNVTYVTYVTCHNCNISISNPWTGQ